VRSAARTNHYSTVLCNALLPEVSAHGATAARSTDRSTLCIVTSEKAGTMRTLTCKELGPTGSVFPLDLRADLEEICGGEGIARACLGHQQSPGDRALDAFLEVELKARGYSLTRNVPVTSDSRFDLDFLITRSNWRAAVLVEGGQAARVDLDLLKFVAFGRAIKWSGFTYAALVVSDKRLFRSITGTGTETAFDYARRLCRLFHAIEPNIADLLVVEFRTGTTGAYAAAVHN
jgi:hypothetical protein